MSDPVVNPFGELIGLRFLAREAGFSRCALTVDERLFNPNRVLHGGVVFTMADNGMGAALSAMLAEHEQCATVEINIIYLKAVTAGTLTCETRVIQRGGRIAFLESEVKNGEQLVAKALGSFSIFRV